MCGVGLIGELFVAYFYITLLRFSWYFIKTLNDFFCGQCKQTKHSLQSIYQDDISS